MRLEHKKNPRLLWRPKLPEMPAQCVSCPFREGNDAEFRAVLTRLKGSLGIGFDGLPISPASSRRLVVSLGQTAAAKAQIRVETAWFGDFSCHQSAYDASMKVRPFKEHRQCPGASAHFVKMGEPKTK